MQPQDSSILQPGPRHTSGTDYRIKAALFDVDNTLVGNESPDAPSKRFQQAAANAKGVMTVALASARPFSKVAHILAAIQAEGLSIISNGAQIINSSDGSVVAEWIIEPRVCSDMTRQLSERGIRFWINDDGVDYFPSPDGSYQRQSDIWDAHSERLPVPDYQPRKPFVIDMPAVTGDQVADVEAMVSAYGDPTITTLVSHETRQPDGSLLYDLFIVNAKANKRDAMLELARLQDVTMEHLMAVGDGRNDAVLVGSAGVGVAMGNSAQETLDVATFTTADRQDDGAAIALEYALSNFR